MGSFLLTDAGNSCASEQERDDDPPRLRVVFELLEVPPVGVVGREGQVRRHEYQHQGHARAREGALEKPEGGVYEDLREVVRSGDQLKPIPARQLVGAHLSGMPRVARLPRPQLCQDAVAPVLVHRAERKHDHAQHLPATRRGRHAVHALLGHRLAEGLVQPRGRDRKCGSHIVAEAEDIRQEVHAAATLLRATGKQGVARRCPRGATGDCGPT
mmetsp:Transcript_3096/g.6220  ORF Transcript_3096/g.6220 Transcript_3096/m.6220 type:complete len:214 (+) Transcript_3096:81-722(+)